MSIVRITAALLLISCTSFAQTAVLRDKAEQAKAAMNAGRFEDAATLYSELVRAYPDVAGMKMNLGMAYYSAGKIGDAVKYFGLAVQGDPALTQAWLLLGVSQMATGSPRDARKSVQRYLKDRPGDLEALQLLGDASLRTGHFRDAISAFEQVTQKRPDNPRAWYGLGRSYEALAGDLFAKLEKAAPDSGYWFALIADSRLAQKQLNSAFFFYRKALDKKPDLRGVHYALSRVYRETGHKEWAEKEEQNENALGEPDCAREPMVCDFLAGRLKEIIERGRKQPSPESYYWEIQASNMLAVSAFSKLSELPSSPEVHELKAEIHRNQGRHWESVNEWKKALELSPYDPRLKQELALALYLKRDYDEAKRLVDELLKRAPQSGELNYLAGDILLYWQKPEEAIPFLEKAVRNSPDLIGARSASGRAYMLLGQPAKAIPHLKIALGSDEDGSLHFQLAQAYQKTGRQALAAEMMAKYQQIVRTTKQEEKKLGEEARITPP